MRDIELGEDEKICTKCGRIGFIEKDFYRRKTIKRGRVYYTCTSHCRTCSIERATNHYKKTMKKKKEQSLSDSTHCDDFCLK